MEAELVALELNHTWSTVPLPSNKNFIRVLCLSYMARILSNINEPTKSNATKMVASFDTKSTHCKGLHTIGGS